MPADCLVLKMEGAEPLSMDESALTGESKQVEKKENDCLISGTCVMRGQAKCLVSFCYYKKQKLIIECVCVFFFFRLFVLD